MLILCSCSPGYRTVTGRDESCPGSNTMTEVFSLGASLPSVASLLPCLDSSSVPVNGKTHIGLQVKVCNNLHLPFSLPPNPLIEFNFLLPGLLFCLVTDIHRLLCLFNLGPRTRSLIQKYHMQMLSMMTGSILFTRRQYINNYIIYYYYYYIVIVNVINTLLMSLLIILLIITLLM